MNAGEDVDVLIERMAKALRRQIESRGLSDPVMVGIRTGGVWVAEKLHPMLGIAAPLGALNINFYRDDFTRIGMHPQVTPSNLPFSVDGRHILLVDDVLFTGRTIRAALNEIFDYGRPASVTLAVLVERNGREIPVQADVVGQSLTLSDREYVKLRGPDPLRLEMTTRDK